MHYTGTMFHNFKAFLDFRRAQYDLGGGSGYRDPGTRG